MKLILFVSVPVLLLAGCNKEVATHPPIQTPSQMVQVLGGTFWMGDSTSIYKVEAPVHLVSISTYYIDTTEITYEKWTEVWNWGLTHGYADLSTGRNGYDPIGAYNPVTYVNWYDVVKWCNARSEKDGLTPVFYTRSAFDTVYRSGQLDISNDAVKWTANGYRLPTEAEWEFAARGGTKSKGFTYSGSNNLDSVAWYYSNNGFSSHQVATKGANELGLYDMSGNVFEWCWDWFGMYSASAQTDPTGPTIGPYRILRGGNSCCPPETWCRVAFRFVSNANVLNVYVGLRCVRCVK